MLHLVVVVAVVVLAATVPIVVVGAAVVTATPLAMAGVQHISRVAVMSVVSVAVMGLVRGCQRPARIRGHGGSHAVGVVLGVAPSSAQAVRATALGGRVRLRLVVGAVLGMLVWQEEVVTHGLLQGVALGGLVGQQLGDQLKQLHVILIVRIFDVALQGENKYTR